MSLTTISHHRSDQAAPLKPQMRRAWIVRWVRADGSVTKHRVYVARSYAERFLNALHADGHEAAMFTSAVDWQEVDVKAGP